MVGLLGLPAISLGMGFDTIQPERIDQLGYRLVGIGTNE
jgi:hypothetical protein